MKFAFIANVEGVTPESYSEVYETAESYNTVAGVDGMDAAKEYVKKLASEGYDLVNLCGDFDDEITAEMVALTEEKLRIKHADYMAEEIAKLEKLESFKKYGIIIIAADTHEAYEMEINSEACDANVIFVKDLEQAKEAAKKLVDKGMYFIELCSWFDAEKTKAVIAAIDGAIPVGTCGEIK